MATYPDVAPGMVRFYSNGLLSKWGFADGDLIMEAPCCLFCNERKRLLVACVRKWLLPAIPQKLEIFEMQSSHNPIRTSSVDGQPVDDMAVPQPLSLDPPYVDVSRDEITKLADELGITYEAYEPFE